MFLLSALQLPLYHVQMNRSTRRVLFASAERLIRVGGGFVCMCVRARIIGYSDSRRANGVGVRGKCSRARSVATSSARAQSLPPARG